MVEFLDVTHSSRVCLDFKNERAVLVYTGHRQRFADSLQEICLQHERSV